VTRRTRTTRESRMSDGGHHFTPQYDRSSHSDPSLAFFIPFYLYSATDDDDDDDDDNRSGKRKRDIEETTMSFLYRYFRPSQQQDEGAADDPPQQQEEQGAAEDGDIDDQMQRAHQQEAQLQQMQQLVDQVQQGQQPDNAPPMFPDLQQHHRPAPPIEDLDSWIRRHGLRHIDGDGDGGVDVDSGDVDNNANSFQNSEEAKRLAEEAQYQQTVMSKIFAETDEEAREKYLKLRRLESWKNQGLELVLRASGGDAVVVAPLHGMAESCGGVYDMAVLWGKGYFAASPVKATADSPPSSADGRGGKKRMQLSLLEEYPESSVQCFVDLVIGKRSISDFLADDKDDDVNEDGKDDNDGKNESDNDDTMLIVDCCKIARALDNETMLNEIVEILMNSVDATNCYSMSQLADELNLASLLERSMLVMLDGLGNVADNESVAEYLTPELQERIATIQRAMQSSIHSQQSRLYFSSVEEYLSIFAERVQYYRERLAQAKEQQAELLREEKKVIRGFAYRRTDFVSSEYWKDIQQKVERQEVRLRTLEIAYKEQKKMFGKRSSFSRG